MEKERLNFLNDGVFAVAITLLAVDLHPFRVQTPVDIFSHLPRLLLFVLSFITVANFWINLYRVEHTIKNITNGVLWVNIAFLLFVTLIPFSLSLLGENLTNKWSLAFYSAVLFGASSMLSLMRLLDFRQQGFSTEEIGAFVSRYVRELSEGRGHRANTLRQDKGSNTRQNKHRGVRSVEEILKNLRTMDDKTVSRLAVRHMVIRMLLAPFYYVLAFIAAFWYPYVGYLLYLAPLYYVQPRGLREVSRETTQETEERSRPNLNQAPEPPAEVNAHESADC